MPGVFARMRTEMIVRFNAAAPRILVAPDIAKSSGVLFWCPLYLHPVGLVVPFYRIQMSKTIIATARAAAMNASLSLGKFAFFTMQQHRS